jgi:Protein of unknown function (DUF2802)
LRAAIGLESLDLRTLLILLVALLCGYLIWLAIRWRRLSKAASYRIDPSNIFRDADRFSPQFSETPASYFVRSGETVDTSSADDDEDDDAVVSLSAHSREQAAELPPLRREPRAAEPDASSFGFDALLEVRQMHHKVDEHAQRLHALDDEVRALREELSAVRAASRVAPAYAEAVSMVRRGLDAHTIAERCGISVAEAELVQALSERGELDTQEQDRREGHG